MADVLRIFISHKMPTDTPLAEAIGKNLALYSGNQVKVTHAGQFRYGEQWRQRIEQELDEADWLILLYTDPDEDWGFCLYECGYFRHIMENDKGNTKRLITFCRRQGQINDALEEFNALVVDEKSVYTLLEDIYLKDPWKAKANLEHGLLTDTAKKTVSTFMGSERVEKIFDVAPSVIFEVVVSDMVKEDLKGGRLSPEMTVSGTKDWWRLFGRDINTGGWQWQELTKIGGYSPGYMSF